MIENELIRCATNPLEEFWMLHKNCVKLFGVTRAVLLAFFYGVKRYARQEYADKDFFYCTIEKINCELGLDRHTIIDGIAFFEKLGIFETKTEGIPRRKYYKINEKRLEEFLIENWHKTYKDIKKEFEDNNNFMLQSKNGTICSEDFPSSKNGTICSEDFRTASSEDFRITSSEEKRTANISNNKKEIIKENNKRGATKNFSKNSNNKTAKEVSEQSLGLKASKETSPKTQTLNKDSQTQTQNTSWRNEIPKEDEFTILKRRLDTLANMDINLLTSQQRKERAKEMQEVRARLYEIAPKFDDGMRSQMAQDFVNMHSGYVRPRDEVDRDLIQHRMSQRSHKLAESQSTPSNASDVLADSANAFRLNL